MQVSVNFYEAGSNIDDALEEAYRKQASLISHQRPVGSIESELHQLSAKLDKLISLLEDSAC